MKIKDKVVWITGASSGIGAELVHQMSRLGAKVVLSARNDQKLKEVYSSANLSKSNGLVLPLDVSEYNSWDGPVDKVMNHFGRIDILINNAGVTQRSLAVDTNIEVDEKIFRINYFGAVALTKEVLPIMISQGSGQVVAISSVVGKFGSPQRTAYSASKHALHGFYDSLRAEVHDKNVKVTIVCPGFIKTDISKSAVTADGSAYGILDNAVNNGMDLGKCCRKIVRSIEREQEEVYIARKELIGIYLKKFFPRLFSKMIRKVKVT